ncbi:MAG: hemerythrin family protein [Rhodospirillaceae bacterium]|jgi:hemerythrin|nr:hemerythrin family protein [Rhodospirillaceae bacterium]MBT5455879.1 hemerythrin family protein [Rhodospirillaceae bacterium]
MSYFPWSDEYSVHLRVIDNDHKDLVNTVNSLHEAISAGAARGQIGQIIGNLAKYVDEHFSREEALMETYDYPDLASHKRLHRHLTRTVYAIRIIFTSKPKKIDPTKLLTFLREWLIHHILQEDTKYTPYLRGDMETETQSIADVSDVPPTPDLQEDLLDETEETVTLTVPAAKAAALRRCARLLTEGGKESIAIEDIVMPVSQMTFEEALHFARPILR